MTWIRSIGQTTFWVAVLATAFAGAPAADEGDACQAACQEQENQCIQRCSEHDDPIECEGACRNTSYECEQRCA